jgi:hypothetical protein
MVPRAASRAFHTQLTSGVTGDSRRKITKNFQALTQCFFRVLGPGVLGGDL